MVTHSLFGFSPPARVQQLEQTNVLLFGLSIVRSGGGRPNPLFLFVKIVFGSGFFKRYHWYEMVAAGVGALAWVRAYRWKKLSLLAALFQDFTHFYRKLLAPVGLVQQLHTRV